MKPSISDWLNAGYHINSKYRWPFYGQPFSANLSFRDEYHTYQTDCASIVRIPGRYADPLGPEFAAPVSLPWEAFDDPELYTLPAHIFSESSFGQDFAEICRIADIVTKGPILDWNMIPGVKVIEAYVLTDDIFVNPALIYYMVRAYGWIKMFKTCCQPHPGPVPFVFPNGGQGFIMPMKV